MTFPSRTATESGPAAGPSLSRDIVARSHLVSLSTDLLEGVRPENYREWGRAGIRAQLLDIRRKKLVMDFIFERDDKSLHVLNAVSPGFTCSIPFSRHIVEHIK